MTKKDLVKELEGLSDDAIIYIEAYSQENPVCRTIDYVSDKVTGDEVENEITLGFYY